MTVKNSNDIDIKQSADILKERFLLLDEAKSLEKQFFEMLKNQKELKTKKNNLDSLIKDLEIFKAEKKVKEKEYNGLDQEQKKKEIEKMKENNKKYIENIKTARAEKPETKYRLENTEELNTICNNCKKICHEKCTCFKTFESCKVYKWSGWQQKTNICKVCNHQKKEHNKEKKKWVKYYEYPKKYPTKYIEDQENNLRKEIENKISELENTKNKGSETIVEIEEKSAAIERCNQEIKSSENDIDAVGEKIKESKRKILKNLFDLRAINEKIKKCALNKNYFKSQNAYIDHLKYETKSFNDNDDADEIEEIKKFNQLFIESENIDVENLGKLSTEQLIEKINNFVK